MHPVAFYFHMQSVRRKGAEEAALDGYVLQIEAEAEYQRISEGTDRALHMLALGDRHEDVEQVDVGPVCFIHGDAAHVGDGGGIGQGGLIVNRAHPQMLQGQGYELQNPASLSGYVVGEYLFQVFAGQLSAQAFTHAGHYLLEGIIVLRGLEFCGNHRKEILRGDGIKVGTQVHRYGNAYGFLRGHAV